MMQAVKRFEPDKGFRLATYAMWWIRASIQEYILHSWSLVKMGTTAAQKKLFFNLRRAKARLQVMDDRQFTQEKIARIATDLGVAEQDVVQMNQRLAAPDHSLNAPLRGDGEGDLEWQDWLVDDTANQEVRLADEQEFVRRKALMDQAMKTLNERERQILIERRLTEDPATLEDLSVKYGVSRERVRQIENRAFEKLQKAVRALTAEEARAIEEARAAGLPALRPSPASLPGPTAPR
jgi:RNA polymerase sigma-32 factor